MLQNFNIKRYGFRLTESINQNTKNMQSPTNYDQSISSMTKEIERQKALKVLEKAKSIKRKVVFLPRGASGSINPAI